MMIKQLSKRRTLVLATIGFAVFSVVGCGKAEDDDEDTSDEASSTVTGTGGGDVTQVGTLAIGSGLASIPDPASMFKATLSSAFGLAAVGNAPLFSALGDDVEGNLSGDVDTLITQITAAKEAQQWETVRTLTEDFRSAHAKCRVMEDTARQVQDLADLATTTCKMKKVGAKGANGLRAITGTLPADGTFFLNAGDADVVRAISVGKSDLGHIAFHISGKTAMPAGYRLKMTFCTEAGKAKGAEMITVDAAAGTMTHELVHHDARTETRDGVEASADFSRHATATGFLTADGDSLIYDSSKKRSVLLENKGMITTATTSFANTFNASVEVTDGELVTRFLGIDENTDAEGVKQTGTRRGMAATAFSGKTAATVAIAEGAGKQSGEFSRGEQASVAVAKVVGFSYDETATPKYKTVTTGKYYDMVNAVDFTADALLKLAAPAEPVLTLAADADCDISSAEVVALPSPNPTLVLSMAECDTFKERFKKGDSLCKAIGDQERFVFEALRADAAANPPPP